MNTRDPRVALQKRFILFFSNGHQIQNGAIIQTNSFSGTTP